MQKLKFVLFAIIAIASSKTPLITTREAKTTESYPALGPLLISSPYRTRMKDKANQIHALLLHFLYERVSTQTFAKVQQTYYLNLTFSLTLQLIQRFCWQNLQSLGLHCTILLYLQESLGCRTACAK